MTAHVIPSPLPGWRLAPSGAAPARPSIVAAMMRANAEAASKALAAARARVAAEELRPLEAEVTRLHKEAS